MTSLLTRLESLTDPSREVSDELLLSWGWQREWPDTPDEVWVSPIKFGALEAQQVYDAADRPHPTASIDDALLGVPEGWFWWLGHLDEIDRRFVATTSQQAVVGTPSHKGFSSTPAIALCIAIVKARGGCDARLSSI